MFSADGVHCLALRRRQIFSGSRYRDGQTFGGRPRRKDEKVTTQTTPFDPADYLDAKEDQIELLRDAFASGETAYVVNAIGLVARAQRLQTRARCRHDPHRDLQSFGRRRRPQTLDRPRRSQRAWNHTQHRRRSEPSLPLVLRRREAASKDAPACNAVDGAPSRVGWASAHRLCCVRPGRRLACADEAM